MSVKSIKSTFSAAIVTVFPSFFVTDEAGGISARNVLQTFEHCDWCAGIILKESFYDHLSSPVLFVSLASHLFVFSPVFFPWFFSLCFISHCFFPLFFFHSFFFPVFPTHPHTLSPQSALPHPLPSLFIQSIVSFVLCICLKIGLGRETFRSNITKVSVKSCGKLSNRVEHCFAGRTTTLSKRIHKN